MPNWCSTNVTIYSEDHNIINQLHDKLEEFIATASCDETKNNTSWLGNLLGHAGYSYSDIIAEKYGYPRGWIQYIDEPEKVPNTSYTSFYVDIEDAWGPHIRVWREFLNKMFPDVFIKLSWVAEEPGCAIYAKYDPEGLFYDNYAYSIDCSVPDESCYTKYPELQEGSDIYSSEEMHKIFGTNDLKAITARATEITSALEEEYGEGYIYVNQYEEAEEEC